MRPFIYSGKYAVITGASAGIGEAFARQLALRGMNLVLAARRLDRLEALRDQLQTEHGITVVPVGSDLAQPGEAARLWAAATQGRQVDLLINNAGFGARGSFHELSLERQVAMVQVNCVAVLELAHHALREMRPRGDGGIINVASIAAFQPIDTLATYAASKAFVLSLSEALWSENRGSGVRVLALCPGRTPTEFQAIAGTGRADSSFGARSADQVVSASLDALDGGKSYDVPGMENYLATWLVRVLPRSTVTRALKGLVKRAGRK